jgi:hypothetical protein
VSPHDSQLHVLATALQETQKSSAGQNAVFFKANNLAKHHSTGKAEYYGQVFQIQINPVMFLWKLH